MFLALLLVVFGIFLLGRLSVKRKKPVKKQTDGEILGNSYIIEHEKKIADEKVYEEYLEWCKIKGELPIDKIGFDEHRMKEFMMYKKLLKNGIGGL
ncbi:MAG: hypothetical protein ACRC8Z_03665 [Empedobacter falsenii]